MKLFTRLAIFFYVLTIAIGCGAVILFASHVFTLEETNHYLGLIYSNVRLRMIVVSTAGALIVLSLIFERIISEHRQKERTIAFDNPSGRVTISLVAMEDLVKRLVYKVSEVKEVRCNMIKTKKGIEVETRLVLRADVHIPDMTARLQDLIKSKIQDMLGVDEIIIVRIHIGKIASEENKSKRGRDNFEEKVEPPIPFQGYQSL